MLLGHPTTTNPRHGFTSTAGREPVSPIHHYSCDRAPARSYTTHHGCVFLNPHQIAAAAYAALDLHEVRKQYERLDYYGGMSLAEFSQVFLRGSGLAPDPHRQPDELHVLMVNLAIVHFMEEHNKDARDIRRQQELYNGEFANRGKDFFPDQRKLSAIAGPRRTTTGRKISVTS